MSRTPTDYTFEYAEYMAKDAERLLEALSEHSAAYMALEEDSDADADQDITAIRERCERADQALGEYMAHMRAGIFEFRKHRDRALAAPAQPDPLHVANERGEGWQPIETAPKDQFILLAAEFDGPGDWRIKMGEYRSRVDEQGRHWHLMGASWHPTRWMPLPTAPKDKP